MRLSSSVYQPLDRSQPLRYRRLRNKKKLAITWRCLVTKRHVHISYFTVISPGPRGRTCGNNRFRLAHLYAWICTVTYLISLREQGGGHRQKLYSKTYNIMLELSISPLIRTLQTSAEYWYPEQLQLPHED